MDGQMNIMDYPEYLPENYSYDRNGKEYLAPKWMRIERCENCQSWKKYQTEEQPPAGHGVYGWCSNNKEKCIKTSYCMRFEKR